MSLFFDALGFIGNVLFGVGCVPSAYKALRDGVSTFPVESAWIIGGACACFYTYLLGTYGASWMTTPIGVIETGSYAIVLWHHYFPRAPKPPKSMGKYNWS